jgi:hypothetical protein
MGVRSIRSHGVKCVLFALLLGDGWLAVEPLVTFAALVLSYMMRPDARRLSDRAVL